MQRRGAAGSPVAVARAGAPPPPPETPGCPARQRQVRVARAGAPAAVAGRAMAPARGAPARRDLHGGAGRPARAGARRVVGVVPAVDRPGALLRHAVRGQHQGVLVNAAPSLCRAAPQRVAPPRCPSRRRRRQRRAAVLVQQSVSNSGHSHGVRTSC